MPGARHANFNRALVLSLLMMMMTQVGYLESMNPWTSDEETLDETNDVLETGGSGSSFAYSNDKVSAGYQHTCAILDNGDLKCWGRDNYGQLGDGGTNTNTNAPSSTAIDLGTGRTAVAVSAGQSHTCAILDNGDLKCWGYNNNGQLGDGSNTNQGSPVAVSGSNTWDTTTTLVTWETHPALPAGMSISGGTISGTPSVYAVNQTYTIYANQSGYSTTHELYFSVDTDNAHTVVENQAIDAIGFHPPFNNGTTAWTASANLPGNLTIDASTGEITGTVNSTFANATITVTATHNGLSLIHISEPTRQEAISYVPPLTDWYGASVEMAVLFTPTKVGGTLSPFGSMSGPAIQTPATAFGPSQIPSPSVSGLSGSVPVSVAST